MILRRFTQHVKNENWFAVSIDFFVVVVGIFIGMQVTEWNQDRKDRIEEREYIERLQGDISQSISLLEKEILDTKEWDADTGFTYQIISKGELLDEEIPRFEKGLLETSRTPDLRVLDSTLREMQSTGKISLIESQEIRVGIGKFDEALRFANKEIVKIENIYVSTLHEILSFYRYDPEDSDLIIYDFEKMVNDQRFIFHLSSLGSSRWAVLGRVERILVAALALNDILINHLEET